MTIDGLGNHFSGGFGYMFEMFLYVGNSNIGSKMTPKGRNRMSATSKAAILDF